MNGNGVSKKLTIAGIGIASLISLKDAQPSILAYCLVAGIVIITLSAIVLQAKLDQNGHNEPRTD